MVALAAAMLTGTRTMRMRSSALTLAMKRLLIGFLLRRRDILLLMLALTVELLKLSTTDRVTDRATGNSRRLRM
jgi:hypothetical protein